MTGEEFPDALLALLKRHQPVMLDDFVEDGLPLDAVVHHVISSSGVSWPAQLPVEQARVQWLNMVEGRWATRH